MQICNNCGHEETRKGKFCPNCGMPYQIVKEQKEMNTMCIVGFVLSFFCNFIGLILSIIGLSDAKKKNQSGEGFAIAGIIISSFSLLFGLAIVIFYCLLVLAYI